MEEHGRNPVAAGGWTPPEPKKNNVKVSVKIPVVYESPGQYDRPEKTTRDWEVTLHDDNCVTLTGGATADISFTFDADDLKAALTYLGAKPGPVYR